MWNPPLGRLILRIFERPPPKGGARRGEAGGRSASREQDVRVTRKITVPKGTGMVVCGVLSLAYNYQMFLLCYREWTCSRVQDRCEAPRLSNLRNFSFLDMFLDRH